MRYPQRSAIVLVMVVQALLAACGTSVAATSTTSSTGLRTATPAPTMTLMPPVLSTDTPQPLPPEDCTANLAAKGPVKLTGTLAVSGVAYGVTGYPSNALPSGIALKPTLLPDNLSNANANINPGLFFLNICNTSATQSVTITQLMIQITSFTPMVGTLDTYQSCDSYYDAGTKSIWGGMCGGGYGPNVFAGSANWPKALAGGMSLPVQVQTPFDPPQLALPQTLLPKQSFQSYLDFKGTPTPGTVSMNLVVTLANHATAQGPISGPYIFTPARRWSGPNCQTPTMLEQITATTGLYICPPAP